MIYDHNDMLTMDCFGQGEGEGADITFKMQVLFKHFRSVLFFFIAIIKIVQCKSTYKINSVKKIILIFATSDYDLNGREKILN